MNEHDRQIPEAIEVEARDRIGVLLSALDGLQARADAVEPTPGGMLERENARTAYDPIGNQVHTLTLAAIEPLETSSLLMQHHGLPMLSLYPLIRSSVEAGAYALWLLSPGTTAKRTFRSLQLTKRHRADADETTSAIAPLDPEKTRWFNNRMEQLKAMTPANKQRDLDIQFPTATSILLDADRHVAVTPYPLVTTWKICSGLAHTNITMHQRILERRQDSEYVNGIAQFHMTSSFEVIERLLRPAVQLITDVVTRSEARAIER